MSCPTISFLLVVVMYPHICLNLGVKTVLIRITISRNVNYLALEWNASDQPDVGTNVVNKMIYFIEELRTSRTQFPTSLELLTIKLCISKFGWFEVHEPVGAATTFLACTSIGSLLISVSHTQEFLKHLGWRFSKHNKLIVKA